MSLPLPLCKAYKSKTELIQCPNKIKVGHFCGKHKNIIIPIFNNNGEKKTEQEQEQELEQELEQEQEKEKEQKQESNIDILENNINTRYNFHKTLEKSDVYVNYLQQRKTYIKDNVRENNRPIELLEYIENSKIDYYPSARILASLEYYNLIKKQDVSRFMLAINNTNVLISLFETLINVNLNMNKIIKLQRWIKKSLSKFNSRIQGPALHNRTLCVNDSDFVSLDEIKDIPECNFFSFKDDTGFIYGFHIDSAIELVFKSDENYYENFKKHSSNLCYRQFIKTLFNHYNKIKIFNPYTRFIIDGTTKLNIIRLYTKHKFSLATTNNNLSQNTHASTPTTDAKTTIRNKCFSIFQKIDFQGYFTDTAWLLDEHPKNIKIFYKKLASLWNFEFGLNNTAKYRISRTHNLFQNLPEILVSRSDKYVLLDKVLDIVNILVSNGETEGDRNTGCILVLYGLSFINQRCILANPWLG